jgi:hypothetical protein
MGEVIEPLAPPPPPQWETPAVESFDDVFRRESEAMVRVALPINSPTWPMTPGRWTPLRPPLPSLGPAASYFSAREPPVTPTPDDDRVRPGPGQPGPACELHRHGLHRRGVVGSSRALAVRAVPHPAENRAFQGSTAGNSGQSRNSL